MNTTQLECFLAVANYLNFSRAADQLKMSQPAVSHQINTLENELGVKLFYRTSRSVRLTQEGYLFTQYAGDILKMSRISKARLTKNRSSTPLHLGLGCRNVTELRLMEPALARLREEMPELMPVLRMIPFDSIDNLLEEGEIQVISTFRDTVPKRARYRELALCPVVCICGESHPLAECEYLTVKRLQEEEGRMAVCRPPIYSPELFHVQSQIVAGRGPDQIFFCDHQEVVYPLVEAGYAFAIMPDFPQIRLPGLRYLPLPEFPPLSFGAAYLAGNTTPVLRRFLVLLEEEMGASRR